MKSQKHTILILFAFTVMMGFNCPGQTKIDTIETIRVGGIGQVITLKGQDRSRPLFLFITGGPGSPGIDDESEAYLGELEKHLVVVRWDQRNCGKTLDLNPSPVKLTVALYEKDAYELVSALLGQFNRKKLFVMGWSWGTVLGFYLAGKHPDLLYAYMAVSPAINQWESERISLKELRQKAVAKKNAQAIKELAVVKIPFENGLQNYYDRKWLSIFNGETIDDTTAFKKYFLENSEMMALFAASNNSNLFTSLPKINCPVYFFAGRTDHQTNCAITEQYYKKVEAPKKELFWFEHSGHLIPVTEPKALQQTVITKILPQINTE